METATRPLQALVHKLEMRAALPQQDRDAILDLPIRLKRLEPSTYVLREGDRPDTCAILLDGYAYRQKITGEGRRQILSLNIPGDALDFHHLFLNVADHSVQMLSLGDVALIPRARVQELYAERPAIAHAIMVDLLADSSIFREWVLNVGRRDARARVAHILCEFIVRLETQGLIGDQPYRLPITQEQLADALGLTPVHVNRTLKWLGAGGYIHRERRHILIPDWERLRDVADINPRYLHLGLQGAADAVVTS